MSQACATHLASRLPAMAIDVAAKGSAHATHQPDLAASLQCPACGGSMNRTKASAAGVELDHCGSRGCGTWYDKDEIKCVTDAIRASGWGTTHPRHGVAVGAAVGAAAVGAVAMGIAASHQQPPSDSSRAEVAVDVVEGVAEVATDGAVEVVAEGGGELVGGIFEVLGGLFSGL